MSAPELPSRARAVIVGGGVIGSSIAYHLAHAGWGADVLLLERDRLTSGTTWHAAGLMTTFGSTSETNTRIRLYSRDLYARLEAETGLATGFRPVGLIEAAADADRWEEYRRVAAFQRLHGLEVEEISPAEMSELFPWARTDDLLAGFHVPGDGRVNPVDLTMSLARGATNLGVRVVEGARVDRIVTDRPLTEGGRVTAVEVGEQRVECETVVLCAGMWTREIAAATGITVPNTAAEHYYLITDTIDGLGPDTPIFEDPAAYGYYREEGGGMMVGLFEPQAAAWRPGGIPRDASFTTLAPDWDRLAPFLETAMARVPITEEAGVRTLFCGPESFTPDLAPAVGEVRPGSGYFVCAGLNSVGVLSAGGLGQVLAHWVTTGAPDVDVTGFDVRRFRPWQAAEDYRVARTIEVLGTVYAAHTPGKQLTSARGILHSPVHERLVAAGGHLREVSGWESPQWYAGAASPPPATPTWGMPAWSDLWAAEHRAVREGVGLLDLSFMAKFEVTGSGAGAALMRLSTARVDADDRITYTQWLSDSGHIVADLTVAKLAADRYLVIASDTAHGAVEAMLQAVVGTAGDCVVTDVAAELAQLNLQGPASRQVLAALTDTDLDDYPFRTARRISVAGHDMLVARITYQGELGYELYPAAEDALATWDALVEAGAEHGLRPVGLAALASLRLEKGYRDFGHDIDNTDCPLESGLGFTVDWEHDFTGRDALAARRQADTDRGGPVQRLVSVRLADPAPMLHHAEPVLRDGQPVGYLRAGSYGWTLGSAVGLAMVGPGDGSPTTSEWLASGEWTVDVAGTAYPAEVSLRPFYDPTSSRVRS